MKTLRQELTQYKYLISHLSTNVGRQHDSKAQGTENRKIIDSFVASGGWSNDYPCVVGEMSGPWYFTFEKQMRPLGCTALEFIARENKRRADKYTELKESKSDDAPLLMKAFQDIYCENDVLVELTLNNAFWVHSGHQRSQFVMFEAYVSYLKSLQGIKEVDTKIPDDERLHSVKEFSLLVPVNVKEFESFDEILTDQMQMNMAQLGVNKLDVLDLTKGGVQSIGTGAAPAIKERDFRNRCAEPGVMSKKGGNSGALPRLAYLLAIINYACEFAGDFYKCLVAPEKLYPEGGPEDGVPNPEWIDVKQFSATHTDPRYNPSVIARLLEPGLEKLSAYVKEYGENGSRLKENEESKVSAVEAGVYKRFYCWTPEEKLQWLDSIKPHKVGYIGPDEGAEKKPTNTIKLEALKPAYQSDSLPTSLRLLVGELAEQKVPLPGAPPVETKGLGMLEKFQSRKTHVNTVMSATDDDPLLGIIETLGNLKDGDRAKYDQIIGQIKTIVDSAITKPGAENPNLPVEGTSTDAQGNVAVQSSEPATKSKSKKAK
jgi:hypothetical protein